MLDDRPKFHCLQIQNFSDVDTKVEKTMRRLFPHMVKVDAERTFDASWACPAKDWIRERLGSESSQLFYNGSVFYFFHLTARWDFHRNMFFFASRREATLFLLRWG